MKKIIYNSCLALSAAMLLLSCEKTEVKDGGGKTLFKLTEGGGDPVVLALNTDPIVEEVRIAGVFRDAASNADYNAAATVTLSNSQALLDAYNDEHDTEFELLPAGSYTVTAASGVTVSGNTWTLNMAAKELDRSISISLNKALLDLSKQYAFGLEITNSTLGEPSLGTGTGIVNILIKNDYDGVYNLTGTMADAGAALDGMWDVDYHLITTGANSVVGWDPNVYEDYYIPIYNGTTPSGYGAYCPIFTFDPVTKKVTTVTNIWGQPASNGRYAAIDPSGVNEWDPVTRDIKVKFFMYQPSVVPLPNPRVVFDWTLEYKGARP